MGEKIKTHVNGNEYADSFRFTIANLFITYLLVNLILIIVWEKKNKAHEISFALN